MPGELITDDWQIDWDGFLMGAGTLFKWVRLDGWEETPDLILGSAARASRHGEYPGRPLARARTVTLTAEILAGPSGMLAAVQALRAATPVPRDASERPLAVRCHGETLLAWGQARRVVPVDHLASIGIAQAVVVRWHCTDPRRYELDERSLVITAPTSGSGGLAYPLGYPLAYGTAGSPNNGNAPNVGSEATRPVLIFTGPITNPRLVNSSLNRSLEFGIDLLIGQTLTVDVARGTVLLNGTTDRLNARSNFSVPVEYFELAPGDNNLTLLAAAFGSGAQLEVLWRSAFM